MHVIEGQLPLKFLIIYPSKEYIYIFFLVDLFIYLLFNFILFLNFT